MKKDKRNKAGKKKQPKKIERLLAKYAMPEQPINDAYMKARFGKPVFSVRKDDGTLEHWYKNR